MNNSAAQIIKFLTRNQSAGVRCPEIFNHFLDITESSLIMLPRHAEALAAHSSMAEDTPEIKAKWERLREIYKSKDYFVNFQQALAALLDSSTDPDGSLTFEDVLGSVYMQFAYPNPGTGQYFTPGPLASAMAKMTVDNDYVQNLVHERIKAAIGKSPLGEALLMAGMILDGAEMQRHLLCRVLPVVIEFYEPVTVQDPACGSGVMLLSVAKELPYWMVANGLVQFYGQDIDGVCCQMARINFRLYGLNGSGLEASEQIRYALAKRKVGGTISVELGQQELELK